MMNALAAMFAAPAAGAVVDLARSGVAAATEPFELLLKAAARRAEEADASNNGSHDGDEQADGDSIRQRLAGKLRDLLASIGGVAGDVVTLRFNQTSGGVEVGDEHPLAATLEAELADDPQIADDLGRLAELEGDDSEWQFELS
jgi:hypothetical protein